MENKYSVSDWQNDHVTLSERGKYVLKSGLWSDCKFFVGSDTHCKEFKAHKLILSMSSPVFATMFHGELCEKGDTKILDITPEAFSSMLEYMYTDDVDLKSFDHACEVCYAAKKYMLPALVKKCTTYIWSDIDPANTCRAYEFARLFDEPDLLNRCMKVIVNQTADILNSPCLVEIDQSTLMDILNQDVLNISDEGQLFRAVEKWIQYRLNFTSDSLKDEDATRKLQSFARPFLCKLRLASMSPTDFATGPAQSPLLGREDILALLMNISAGPRSHIPMPAGFSLCRSPRWYTRNKDLDLAGRVFWLQSERDKEIVGERQGCEASDGSLNAGLPVSGGVSTEIPYLTIL